MLRIFNCFMTSARVRFNIIIFLFLIIVYSVSLYLAKQKDNQLIMTVNGQISANKMGRTLAHEHILVDFIGADSIRYDRWNRVHVTEQVTPFLEEIKKYGVSALVECTPEFLGRDPYLLKMLSEKTGLNILTNTGLYGAHNNIFLPDYVQDESAEQLAKRWLKEWESGIEESGVRPGFIKIAVGKDSVLTPLHQKLVMAAAMTHLQSGLTIMSHTGPDPQAFQQIELLQQAGVAPEAFIWTHANQGTPAGHVKAARMGVWVAFDKLNGDPREVNKYAGLLINMKNNGLLDKVLISHDAGWYDPGKENGGEFRPYTTLFSELLPLLKDKGFSQKEIDGIMISNPRNAFTVRVRKL